MPFQLNDASAGLQRMQIDNNAYTEFGQSVPSGPLSFRGRQLLDGSSLSQRIARPAAMPRITGSVTMSGGSTVVIYTGPTAGFGVVNGNAGILCSVDKTQFTIYPNYDSSTRTVDYAVF